MRIEKERERETRVVFKTTIHSLIALYTVPYVIIVIPSTKCEEVTDVFIDDISSE